MREINNVKKSIKETKLALVFSWQFVVFLYVFTKKEILLLTGYISETMKLGALGLPPYRTFALEELKEATSNFSTLNLIEGSHSKVCHPHI